MPKITLTVKVLRAVRLSLTPDLLREPYRARVLAGAHPTTGHCYVASEALWHLLGGPASRWGPAFVRHEGSPHWFLRQKDGRGVLDPTVRQFREEPPYARGVNKGFLTRQPSSRARKVMYRAQQALR